MSNLELGHTAMPHQYGTTIPNHPEPSTSGHILIANMKPGMTITGHYRLSFLKLISTGTYPGIRLIRIKDRSRTLKCIALPEVCPAVDSIAPDAVVRVTMKIDRHPSHGLQGTLQVIQPVAEVPLDLTLDLLPWQGRGSRSRLDRFIALMTDIAWLPPLRQFIERVLSDSAQTHRLLTLPASYSFHHTERGGLFRHIVEAAEWLAEQDALSAEAKQVAIAAILFHDIGKIRTLNWRGCHTPQGRSVRHEAYILEICAEGLRFLDKEAPEIATTLRHIWTAAYPGQYGIQPQTPLVTLVRQADRCSVRSDRQRQDAQAPCPQISQGASKHLAARATTKRAA